MGAGLYCSAKWLGQNVPWGVSIGGITLAECQIIPVEKRGWSLQRTGKIWQKEGKRHIHFLWGTVFLSNDFTMKMSKQVANVKFGEISGKWIKGKSREEKEKREKLERLGWSSSKDSLSTKQNEKAIKSKFSWPLCMETLAILLCSALHPRARL